MATMQITGIPQTLKVFEELPHRQQKKVLPKVVRAGGGPFLNAARRKAPVMNGTLKRSLILVVRRYSTGSVAVVGQDKTKKAKRTRRSGGISGRGDVVPSHFPERGTKAHTIRAKAKTLKFGYDVDEEREGFRRVVQHPGTRGVRFIERAGIETMNEAIQKSTDKLTSETIAEAISLGLGTHG